MREWVDYLYPESTVLRNKLNLTSQQELDRFERSETAIRIAELKQRPINGDFDLAHMQAIHKEIFKNVYEWAGEIRTVDMAKGAGKDRTVFTYVEDIPKHAAVVTDMVREANAGRGLDRKEAAMLLGDVYAEVNNLHPFREGNGRATREFMRELAERSGHELHFERVSKDIWNDAAKESAHGNPEAIRKVFYDISMVERAVAFDRQPSYQALGLHPELDGAFTKLAEAHQRGIDVAMARRDISRELHEGKIVGQDAVSVEHSKIAIDQAASFQGLMVRDAVDVGGTQRGEIVAVSSNHALLKVGDMVALRLDKENLDRQVYPGEKVAIAMGREQSQVYVQGREPEKVKGSHELLHEREYSAR